MLCLHRKTNELIGIQTSDGMVTIRVVDICCDGGRRNRRTRLGINAPSNVVVHREEVWRRIAEATGLELPEELRTETKHD
jgi:carbon storage regulator CsrA